MANVLIRVCAVAALAAGAASAQEVDWQYPAIESYGPAVPVPGTTARMEEPYRVVFNITEGRPGDGRVSSDLALVARFVNLLALSDMDPAESELVAVVHAAATPAVVDDAAYRARFGTANPNGDLIIELVNHGVEVVVCGQALAGAGFPIDSVAGGVDVSISAMTEIAARQMDGYALMP